MLRYSDGAQVSGPGTVLMDNTTVFGAKHALDAWPPTPADWTSGPLSVDLRSLMDLLEAFVLHDKIVVDNGSRSYDLWPSLPWLPSSLGAETPTGDGVLIERDLVGMTMPEAPGNTEIPSALISAALDTVQTTLASGPVTWKSPRRRPSRGPNRGAPLLLPQHGEFR